MPSWDGMSQGRQEPSLDGKGVPEVRMFWTHREGFWGLPPGRRHRAESLQWRLTQCPPFRRFSKSWWVPNHQKEERNRGTEQQREHSSEQRRMGKQFALCTEERNHSQGCVPVTGKAIPVFAKGTETALARLGYPSLWGENAIQLIKEFYRTIFFLLKHS